MAGWLLSLPCTRAEAERLSGEVPALDALPEPPVIVTREIDEAAGQCRSTVISKIARTSGRSS
jgi:hypothetical protein